MRFRFAVLSSSAAIIAFQLGLHADVSPLPRWVVVGSAADAVEHDGKVYLGGEFTHLYRANPNHDQVLEATSGAVKTDCARRTNAELMVGFITDRSGGLFVPTRDAGALDALADRNGPFEPGSSTRFLRIRPDCTFDRVFQPSSVDPAQPTGILTSIYGAGSVVVASTSAPFSGVAGIAVYDGTSGQRLAFREYPSVTTVEFLGPASPDTVVTLLRVSGGDVLAHLNLSTLDFAIQSGVVSEGRRYWHRGDRVFVWESPPFNHTGDWLKPLESIDAQTLQATAGWTNPVPHATFVSGSPRIPGGFTDIEVVGNRVFLGGTDRVNGQAVPMPAALHLASGIIAAGWTPPALSPVPGTAGPTFINELHTDGLRLFLTAINLGRVGSAERVTFAALNATTAGLDAWAPKVAPRSGGFATLHSFAGGLYIEGISGIEGQERRYLAAIDASTGELTPWNPYVSVSNRFGLTAIANDQRHLYVSAQLTGMVHRIEFATGMLDPTWSLSLSRGVAAGARSLVVDGSTLYLGGPFESVAGTGSANSFPQTTRRSVAAVSLITGQLTPWNPDLSGPTTLDGAYAMALAGTTMFIGGNFATTTFGGIGLIGVNTTTGAITVPPPSGLIGVTSLTSDGTQAFAAGRTVNGDVLLSLHPAGALTFIPLTLPPVGNQRFTHFRGRLYALGERDDVTLQSTGSPLEFSSAWRGTDGVIVWDTGAASAIQYHPFADSSPPNAPRNLLAQTSGNNVMLTWSPPAVLSREEAPAGVTSSYVVRAGSGPGLSNLADFDTGSLNTALTAFAPNGTYYVRVHARNAFGVSAPSNEVQFTVGPPVCTSPPGTPGTLVVAVSELSASFTWGPAARATSYVLEAGAALGGAELAVLNVGGSLAFSASAPPGIYYVRVRGSNACGNGPASNDVMVTLGTPVVVPGPPANLAFTRDGNVVTLTWGAPVTGDAAASYVLEAGSAPGLSNLAIVPIAGTTIAATAPPGTYYVRVRGVNSAGQGPPSNESHRGGGGTGPAVTSRDK